MLDDLKRQQELDAFQGDAMSGERCLLICVVLLGIALFVDYARFRGWI